MRVRAHTRCARTHANVYARTRAHRFLPVRYLFIQYIRRSILTSRQVQSLADSRYMQIDRSFYQCTVFHESSRR